MDIPVFEQERMQSLYEGGVEVNLSESGVHPLRIADLLEEPAAAFVERELGYPHSPGSHRLRSNIATWYPGASPENVTVTNGGAEANFLSLWTLLEGNDSLAFMLPNYMQGFGIGEAFANVQPFHLVKGGLGDSRRWELDVDELRSIVSPSTKVIFICNPNNPTAAVLTQSEMEHVVEIAASVDAWIVADEIYRGAEASDEPTPTFWGSYPRTIITSGMSKAFGLPGLRLGWTVAPPDVIERIWQHRDYTTLMVGILSDTLAAVAHDPVKREQILERTRQIVRRNLQPVIEWADRNGDLVEVVAPRAGAIAYIQHLIPLASAELVDRLRKEESVLVIPGYQFGVEGGFRVGFGHSYEDTVEGLSRIQKLLRRLV